MSNNYIVLDVMEIGEIKSTCHAGGTLFLSECFSKVMVHTLTLRTSQGDTVFLESANWDQGLEKERRVSPRDCYTHVPQGCSFSFLLLHFWRFQGGAKEDLAERMLGRGGTACRGSSKSSPSIS